MWRVCHVAQVHGCAAGTCLMAAARHQFGNPYERDPDGATSSREPADGEPAEYMTAALRVCHVAHPPSHSFGLKPQPAHQIIELIQRPVVNDQPTSALLPRGLYLHTHSKLA